MNNKLEKIKEFIKNNKWLTIIPCIILVIVSYMVFDNMNKKQVHTYVCQSSIEYNQGIGINFDVQNGKIIRITKVDTVTKEFIKNNLEGADVDAAFATYKENTKKSFEELAQKYKNNKTVVLSFDDTHVGKVISKYIIEVGSKYFSFKESKDALNEFGLMHYYDKDKKAFIYNKEDFLKNTPLATIPKVTCEETKN